jgi:hypothetical protein
VIVPPVAVKLESRVVPPTIPVSVMAPVPDVKVTACDPAVDPLTVPPKVIAPLFALVSIVVVPAKENLVGMLFVITNEFAVILLLMTTEDPPPDDETNRAPSRFVPPTTPVNVIVEPALTVRVCDPAAVPLIVLLNIICRVKAVLILLLPVKITGDGNV